MKFVSVGIFNSKEDGIFSLEMIVFLVIIDCVIRVIVWLVVSVFERKKKRKKKGNMRNISKRVNFIINYWLLIEK